MSENPKPIIQVQDVSKFYGQRKVIEHMNFQIQEGEVVGFLGPNGAGKTTTMKMLTGFMSPTSGQILIDGVDIFAQPLLAKSSLGYLPETPPLYMEMSVQAYLSYVCDLKKVSKANKQTYIDEVIRQLKLQDVRGRMLKNLSKGFKQRVGIAQALVSKPKLIILDEPTVGLDPTQVAEFRQVVQELRGKHTLILSTHILSEVQATCDRVIIINQGKIVVENTIEGLSQLMTGAKSLLLKVQNPHVDLLRALEELDFVLAVESEGQKIKVQCDDGIDHVEKLALLVMEHKAGLLEIKTEDVPLEKIFIELTHGTASKGGPV